MTPGYAKPRAELPWLPYSESDKVFVINSHNFDSAYTPAVNGKMPVAAWVESRDEEATTSTVATDFVAGLYNGTLTNMSPASDRVSDTGAGGVRALDFDGVDDIVLAGGIADFSFAQNTATWTVSIWVKLTSLASAQIFIGNTAFSAAEKGFAVMYETGRGLGTQVIRAGFFRGAGVAANTRQFRSADNSFASTDWVHVVAGMNGASSPFIFINGVASVITNLTTDNTLSTGNSTRSLGLGRANFGSVIAPMVGRLDDIRIFNVDIDATDAADLYAAQRGGNA
jgi:hypothetical protein